YLFRPEKTPPICSLFGPFLHKSSGKSKEDVSPIPAVRVLSQPISANKPPFDRRLYLMDGSEALLSVDFGEQLLRSLLVLLALLLDLLEQFLEALGGVVGLILTDTAAGSPTVIPALAVLAESGLPAALAGRLRGRLALAVVAVVVEV